jgi:hypothetical protein
VAFGDTILSRPSESGVQLLSNTGALGATTNVTQVGEPVDASGAPFALLGWTPEEFAYNLRSGSPGDRFALWPTALARRPDGRVLLGYLKLKVRDGAFEALGAGIAHALHGKTFALREPGLVFEPPEPLFVAAGMLDGGYLNVFDCDAAGCSLARVDPDRAGDGRAYEFWDGSAWVPDVTSARPVMLHSSPSAEEVKGGMTVSWNPHLDQYIATYVPGGSQNVVMRTAPELTGPWTRAATTLITRVPAPGSDNYSAKEHLELSSDGGRTLVVTYARGTGFLSGEVRAAEVTMR